MRYWLRPKLAEAAWLHIPHQQPFCQGKAANDSACSCCPKRAQQMTLTEQIGLRGLHRCLTHWLQGVYLPQAC